MHMHHTNEQNEKNLKTTKTDIYRRGKGKENTFVFFIISSSFELVFFSCFSSAEGQGSADGSVALEDASSTPKFDFLIFLHCNRA